MDTKRQTRVTLSAGLKTLGILVVAGLVSFQAGAQFMSAHGSSALIHIMVESYADMDADGLIDDVEQALGCDPYHWDTDADGVPDGWEIRQGLNPRDWTDADADVDRDELSNLDEFELGTYPYEADSDGDHFWDGIEILRGTDPLNSGDYPVSYMYADVDRDNDIDATDIQYVINGALGLPVPVPTNVNGVGDVNALDVQAVINAAAGL